MDLNYLLHRHQVSLMRADAAACGPSRLAHSGLAALYAGAVSRTQLRSGGLRWLIRPVDGETGNE